MVGEYRVEAEIGEGGMGTVYGARHPLIGKRAAIKVISRELSANQDAVERFVVEAQSVNQVGHPNIVDIFAFGTLPDARSYFVMEWLAGQSLAERMREPVPFGEVVRICDAIARALEAAHEAGVIHRDLKPDNVFLAAVREEPPRIKLLDFGLAKLSRNEQGIGRTRTGVVFGTPLYLPPEQAKGARVDFRADIYALGVMLYELATGTMPFVADSGVEIMAKHISEPAPHPLDRHPGLPPSIVEILQRMLAKSPEARPSLREVRAAITPHLGAPSCPPRWEPAEVWLAGEARDQPGRPYPTPLPRAVTPSLAVDPGPTSLLGSERSVAVERPRRRGPLIAAAVAVIGVVVGGAVLLALGRHAPGDQLAIGSGEEPAPVVTTVHADAAAVDVASNAPDEERASTGLMEHVPATEPIEQTGSGRGGPSPPPSIDQTTAHGTIVLSIAPPGARVTIDGTTVAIAHGRAQVELPPGEHAIVVTASRRKPVTRTVRITAGARTRIHVALARARDLSPATGSGSSVDIDAVHDPYAN